MSRRPARTPSPHDDAPTYALDEITDLAGVTPRTVRYYIAEGLLPPPQSLGRKARYTHEHLERLHLINRLKGEFLPLREIRRQLTAMSPEDIAETARHHPQPDPRIEEGSAPAPETDTWRRLPITADAELVITTDAYDRRPHQVDAALTWLRRILRES